MPVIINDMDVAVEPTPRGEAGQTSASASSAVSAGLRREIAEAVRRELELALRRQRERDARLRAD